MIIGLDYDDTYTRDPKSWDVLIMAMQSAGHKVILTTWRNESEIDSDVAELVTRLDGAYFTNREAKAKYVFAKDGTIVDVWIDDNPLSITKTMEASPSGIWM